MINQQLLNYVKQQLLQGVEKEEIKSALIKNGWREIDIEESFISVNGSVPSPQPPSGQYSNFSVKEPIKTWKIVVPVVVGLILLGAGAYFIFQNFYNPTEEGSNKITEEQNIEVVDQPTEPAKKFQINLLDITTFKNTYNVGEKFAGGYLLNYSGDPAKVIVLYGKSRSGFEKKYYAKFSGIIKTGGFDSNSALRETMRAFVLNKNSFRDRADFFEEAGEYTFSISIYKCEDLRLDDEKCSATDVSDDFILSFNPVSAKSKTITVIEKDSPEEKPTVSEKPVISPTEKTVLDCKENDAQCLLDYLEKFEEELASCKPSKGIVMVGLEPALGIARNYEIVGVKDNLCVVNFGFVKIPNIDEEGVPTSLFSGSMVCKYGSSERNLKTVAKITGCSGSLYENIKNAGIYPFKAYVR